MYDLDYTEMNKLIKMLIVADIEIKVIPMAYGLQVLGNYWDVVINPLSMGSDMGRLEIFHKIFNEYSGYLTAEQVFEEIRRLY